MVVSLLDEAGIAGGDLLFVICYLLFVICLVVVCCLLLWGSNTKMNADELEQRLIDFAVRVIKLADSLPKSPAGRHIGRQLLRCGTSPAPNYAEARGAESKADFVHKLKIASKELNETCVWLKMICRAEMMNEARVTDLIDENR